MKITLDGLPALLRWRDGFALVCRRDGKGGDVEFSRAAANRVIAKDGAFKS